MNRLIPLSIMFLFLLIVLPVTVFALDRDYPSASLLFGKLENDHLAIRCNKSSETEMTCKFTQVYVRKKAKPKDLEKDLSNVDEILKEEQEKAGQQKKDCDFAIQFSSGLIKGEKPDNIDKKIWEESFENLHPKHKADFVSRIKKMEALCKDLSGEALENYIRVEHEIKTRTCIVGSNTFEESFTRLMGLSQWVSNKGPDGKCGVIVISTFTETDDSDIFWVYKTKKIVTNKEGTEELGLFRCDWFDEREFFYDWKSKENFLQCDYIEFGY